MSRITGAIALMLALVILSTGSVAAADQFDQFDSVDTVEMIFYPFLPGGQMIDETGPWYGSITVQNLEQHDVQIWAMTDAGFDPANALGTYVLPPNGAITLSSAALDLAEPGSTIVVAGVFRSVWEAEPELRNDAIESVCGPPPPGTTDGNGWLYTCKPSIAGVAKLSAPGQLAGPAGNRTDGSHLIVDGYNAIPAQDVAWGSQSAFCGAIVANWPDDCSGIGTYEPLGYGIGFVFDGHSYLPIVQTNSGWNTVLHMSNVDPSVWAGQVNVTLIASHQQGSAASDEHKFTFEQNLLPGETWRLDLTAHGVPEDWVGSAHITSNVGVVALASRVKSEADMLMTNVAAPSTWATTSPGTEEQIRSQSAGEEVAGLAQESGGPNFHMYAPLIFLDYNGWNTGISIANIDEAPNRVNATFYGPTGNIIGMETRMIAPQGQEYLYMPAPPGQDIGFGQGWVGSVVLSADARFHAVIDQVKYETGEAMSYMATAAGAWAPDNPDAPEFAADTLALPLMQKGYPDGSGDNSGIQLFNPSSAGPVDVEVVFHSQTGNLLEPTNYGPIRVTVPARGNFTIYSMNLSGMIPNTGGTATVRVVGGEGHLVGVSNNVNYAVSGDGSVAFNLVNTFGQYRLPISQTYLP